MSHLQSEMYSLTTVIALVHCFGKLTGIIKLQSEFEMETVESLTIKQLKKKKV